MSKQSNSKSVRTAPIKCKIQPRAYAWVLNAGKAMRVYVNAAIYHHPASTGLPRVTWPKEHIWRTGWTYHVDTCGWIHEEHLFATLNAAMKSVKPT